jgi:hypothetical protein
MIQILFMLEGLKKLAIIRFMQFQRANMIQAERFYGRSTGLKLIGIINRADLLIWQLIKEVTYMLRDGVDKMHHMDIVM